MNFATAAKNNSIWTRTENGAAALNTTGDARLDLYSTIGALREADEARITRLFSEAYRKDPLFATKIAFYGRDIRGGLGEREVFRTIIRYMAKYHPEALRPNLDLIGVYGRYDDMYCLIGTPLENAMSSKKTRALGIMTARKLGYDVYTFKRLVRAMRKQIGIVEALMSAGRWNEIKYPEVPSRAMMIYRNAFMKHDRARFSAFVNKAVKGEVKIHSGVLYPYDIVEKVMTFGWSGCTVREDDVLEAQWRQLPDYVEKEVNALVIADTSGSMRGRPLATSVGLAIYFAEHNKGAFHNMFMSFSRASRIHVLRGETLAQKISSINMSDWDNNTNLEAAISQILEIYDSIPEEKKGDGTSDEYRSAYKGIMGDSFWQTRRAMYRNREGDKMRSCFIAAISRENDGRLIYLIDDDRDEKTFCYPGTWDNYSQEDLNDLVNGAELPSAGLTSEPSALVFLTAPSLYLTMRYFAKSFHSCIMV